MLVITPPEINLGTLKFGKAHKFKYNISNPTSHTCTVSRLVVGCSSCTTASMTKKILAPGENTQVDVVFTPGSTGIQLKQVSLIYLENGKEVSQVMKFKANVTNA